MPLKRKVAKGQKKAAHQRRQAKEQPKDNNAKEEEKEERIISERLWDIYCREMFPARPLKGEELALLKSELESDFLIDPDSPDGDEIVEDYDYMTPAENLLKFTKKVGGLFWINAVHQFEEPSLDDEYAYNSADDLEEEEWEKIQEREREFGGKYTPLTYVLENDCSDKRMVELLLHYGADPNIRDGKGRPPLWKAVVGHGPMGPRAIVVDYLLEEGANPLAVYGENSVANIAKDLAKSGEEVRRSIWHAIKRKCESF